MPPVIAQVERLSEADQVRHMVKVLHNLPVRHAVLRVPGMPADVICMADVPDVHFGPVQQAFMEAAIVANGRSPADIAAAIARRRNRLAGRERVDDVPRGGDDGSIF